MKTIFLFIILFFVSIPFFALDQTKEDNDVYELISSRIREEIRNEMSLSKVDKVVAEGLRAYNYDGSFSGIDYNARDITGWPPLKHIEFLYDFVFAYTIPESKYYKNQTVYEAIGNGLSFWYNRNPESDNWWYNQISEPQRIGILLLQMQTGEKRLSDNLVAKTLDRMRTDGGNPMKQTGANKTDVALHWLYRACLTKDAELLRLTMEEAFKPLHYTTQNGIQYDNSYFQHGRQLYIIGYGDALLKGIIKFAMYVRGTEFQLDNDQLVMLDKFVRESYLMVIRGQFCHFNVMGRGMSRVNATKKEGAIQYCKSMAALLPKQAIKYNEAIARLSGLKPAGYGIKPVSTIYFEGDYALHMRPAYSFGVRTVSSRTVRNEYGNGENLQTYFVSDGSTHITVKGDEYYNIFPMWNWAHIPGTTSPEIDIIPKAEKEWQTSGTSTFTGGASDSLYSVFTYVYEDNYAGINTSAKKSWFFFDDEIVCLGSNITSTSVFPINTTLNQCLLQNDIIISDGGKEKKIGNKKYSSNSLKWVLHGGIGYMFPKGGDINISSVEQSGSWKKITQKARNTIEKKDVFTLRLNHGLQPKQKTYAYIIVPDKHTAQEMNKYDIANIDILVNSDSVQVVQNKKLDMWQMIFFKPTSFTYDDKIVKVNSPCAIILKNMNSKPVLHIADPAHSQTKIDVEILGVSAETYNIVCDFNETGVYAGKTKSYILK